MPLRQDFTSWTKCAKKSSAKEWRSDSLFWCAAGAPWVGFSGSEMPRDHALGDRPSPLVSAHFTADASQGADASVLAFLGGGWGHLLEGGNASHETGSTLAVAFYHADDAEGGGGGGGGLLVRIGQLAASDAVGACEEPGPRLSTGLFVWPSAILLAEFLWLHRAFFRGKRVLELGAGVGLAGIVAAKLGAAAVAMTDRGDEPAILDNLRRNCSANGVSGLCLAQPLTWGRFTAETLALRAAGVDILLAADCLYASRDFDAFFCTVAFLLSEPAAGALTRASRCLLLVFPERGSGFALARVLRKWGLVASRPLCHPPPGSSQILSGRSAEGGEELVLLRITLMSSQQATRTQAHTHTHRHTDTHLRISRRLTISPDELTSLLEDPNRLSMYALMM